MPCRLYYFIIIIGTAGEVVCVKTCVSCEGFVAVGSLLADFNQMSSDILKNKCVCVVMFLMFMGTY